MGQFFYWRCEPPHSGNGGKDLQIGCYDSPIGYSSYEYAETNSLPQDIETKLDRLVAVRRRGEEEGSNIWDNIQSLIINDFSRGSNGDWKTIFEILQRKLSTTNNLMVLTIESASFRQSCPVSLVGLDEKLAMPYFPTIRRLIIRPIPYNYEGWTPIQLPLTCESIGRFQMLTRLSLGASFPFTVESLHKLADSIENLPSLERFSVGYHWVINDWQPLQEQPDQQHHPGLEALFCALWNHPTLKHRFISKNGKQRLENPGGGGFRLVDYEIPQYFWDILKNGPTIGQELNQMKRQGRLPRGFPENSLYNDDTVGLLVVWVEAIIAVKDNDNQDHIFRYLLEQLPPHVYQNAASNIIEPPPVLHGNNNRHSTSTSSTEQQQQQDDGNPHEKQRTD